MSDKVKNGAEKSAAGGPPDSARLGSMNRDAVPPEELDIPEEIIFASWLACVR